MVGLSSEFIKIVGPVFETIKSRGYTIYIRASRKYEDGIVPVSVWVPGLSADLSRVLFDALSHFDSSDHESITTTLLTSDIITSEGWEEY